MTKKLILISLIALLLIAAVSPLWSTSKTKYVYDLGMKIAKVTTTHYFYWLQNPNRVRCDRPAVGIVFLKPGYTTERVDRTCSRTTYGQSNVTSQSYVRIKTNGGTFIGWAKSTCVGKPASQNQASCN